MYIKVGKYIIKSDPYNVWIEEEYTSRRKKKDGSVHESLRTRNITGYHHNFTSLINAFISRKINSIEAQEVKLLLLEIAKVKKDAIELSLAAYEQGKGYQA